MQLAYNGTGFLGWQIQPQEPTVQGEIEKALSLLLHTPTAVTGAGRTDTGVNASMMVAHFDASAPLPSDLVYRLNCLLGKNIAIRKISQVADTAHARFDATSRTYHYYAATAKNPFLYPLSWQAPPGLDFDAMNAAAAHLLGRQDFTSFSKLHTQVKTNICTVTEAHWNPCGAISEPVLGQAGIRRECCTSTAGPGVGLTDADYGLWRFTITADRFLRNMVRAVVGTLVEVGRHKIPPEAVADIIARRDRCCAGTSMPPQALFLANITY